MPITPASYHALNYTITIYCRRCNHTTPLDLSALIARGLGDRDLGDLRFVCRLCGGHEVGWIIGGERAGRNDEGAGMP